MATTSKKKASSNKKLNLWKMVQKKYHHCSQYISKEFILQLFHAPNYMWLSAVILFLVEIFVSLLVIRKIKYTEIDWEAYMSEIEGVVNGTWDYSKLEGATGPLVYPAGFVYIFMGLYYLTDFGKNILRAQYIFGAIYLFNIGLVFRIYHKTARVPPYALIFMCCTSYRIHSIFMLRLFNDPIAMVFLYIAVNYFLDEKWNFGCVFFSLAVSIKMNILLFAPALLLLLLAKFGLPKTVEKLSICAVIQVFLALPFLINNPMAYLTRAFNIGRVFMYEWTVNWRFLPEQLFLDRKFHIVLLSLHLSCLIAFFCFKYHRYVNVKHVKQLFSSSPIAPFLTCNQITIFLFTSNFIGMCFSRSLHYQFYIWYFHTLPYLLWSTKLPSVLRLLLLGLIELSWNTYPSTVASSISLHTCHFILLCALWFAPPPSCNHPKVYIKKK